MRQCRFEGVHEPIAAQAPFARRGGWHLVRWEQSGRVEQCAFPRGVRQFDSMVVEASANLNVVTWRSATREYRQRILVARVCSPREDRSRLAVHDLAATTHCKFGE